MRDKIKVAHIITLLELGGAQNNTLYTVRNLDRNKFDVLLICGKGGILDDEAQKIPRAGVYFIPALAREINFLKDLFSLARLVIILLKEQPDIVHTHSSKAGILGRWATIIARVPFIIHTFHGFGFNDFQKPVIKKAYILSEKITALISSRLVFVSKQNMETALKLKIGSEGKYELIRSGIKISDYTGVIVDKSSKKKSLNLPENARVVTTICPFKPQKNLADFIEVAKNIAPRFRNTYFLVIGDGRGRNRLESAVKSYSLHDRVLFLGWRKDIPEILAVTDIFAMTALWEGLPRSAVEALVSGKPVIAYEIDGNKDIIKNNYNGFLIKPKETASFSEKLALLLSDNSLLQTLSEQAKKSIDKTFDIEYMVMQQENMYLELAGQTSR